jgi:hypothetical protein
MNGLRRLICFATATVATALGLAAVTRPPVEVLRRDLDRILSQPEYRRREADWLYGLVIRALRSLLVWWRDHVANRLEGLAERAPILYWGVVVLTALLAVLLIYHIYVTMRSAFGTGRRRGAKARQPAEAGASTQPEALLEQAEAAAAAGRFAEALRYLYLALIHHLDRADIVRYDRSRTNQEYLRQARRHPAVLEPLKAVTALADRAWYGHYALGWTEYERCHELVRTAWEEGNRAAPV